MKRRSSAVFGGEGSGSDSPQAVPIVREESGNEKPGMEGSRTSFFEGPRGSFIRLASLEEGLTRVDDRRVWGRRAAVAGLVGLCALLGLLVACWSLATSPSMIVMSLMTGVEMWVPDKCVSESVPVPRIEDMTLDEKLGQLTQVDQLAVTPSAGHGDDMAKYFIGSVLSGGGGAPIWGNTGKDWADLVDHLQSKMAKTRLKIPIVYGVDAVHGNNNLYGTTIFPHHVGLGATRNADLVRRIGAAAARETAGTGIRWAFSPAVSVCQDPRWGRCYESFSELTEVVQNMTSEITGWQTRATEASDPAYGLNGEILVAATAKHYIGDGGTQGGKDQGNTIVPEETLRRVHLPPYIDAIKRDVETIMISYSSWNGFKMHGNRYLITDVLKKELGFQGVVVSDWAAIQQLPGEFDEQVRNSINAGLDMIMVPTTYKEFISTLKAEVLAGRVLMSRIDDAVSRVLRMKKRLGLFEDACAPRELLATMGSKPHRETARQAVSESLVLLKNEKRETMAPVFPVKVEGLKVLVTGSHADNIGLQCGGWSITWQGSSGDITPGTTILEGIMEVAGGRAATIMNVTQPTGEEDADIGFIIVGEPPYAEFMGDNQALQLDSSAQSLIQTVCDKMTCVVVLVSGRPLQINYILPKVDAFVAAWLPGTEGAGVADTLFGERDFKGVLPITWFAETVNLPSNSLSKPLFSVGYGLTKEGKKVGGGLPEKTFTEMLLKRLGAGGIN